MSKKIKLNWESGTGYDFFISLFVLHNPDYFKLRSSWAGGMRQRIPQPERDSLAKMIDHIGVIPSVWLMNLSGSKDAKNVLTQFSALSPAEKLASFVDFTTDFRQRIIAVIENKKWTPTDREDLRNYYLEMMGLKRTDQELESYLTYLAEGQVYMDEVTKALQSYYKIFFKEEETRIKPYLDQALTEIPAILKSGYLPDILTELSGGVRFTDANLKNTRSLTFVPSFWVTPRILNELIGDGIFIYGIRPDTVSLIPGEQVPDNLVTLLDAVSNPTRLKILRLIFDEELSPTQIAKQLRLRPPTVSGHLKMLRLAGLVYISSRPNQKEVFYKTRPDRMTQVSQLLSDFIAKKD